MDAMKRRTGSGSPRSTFIPRTTSPSFLCVLWRWIKWGMDSRQGLHQVAQKSRRTTLPLNVESVISWLSRDFSVKSGADDRADSSFPHFASVTIHTKLRVRMTNHPKNDRFKRNSLLNTKAENGIDRMRRR